MKVSATARPVGAGLALDAGPVSGGGYLYFDYENGEYAGALELDEKAKDYLIEKGYNPDFGARPLRRARNGVAARAVDDDAPYAVAARTGDFEIKVDEYRVALTPAGVRELTNVNFHCSPAASVRPDGSYAVEAVTATASFRFGKSMAAWFERSGAKVIVGKAGLTEPEMSALHDGGTPATLSPARRAARAASLCQRGLPSWPGNVTRSVNSRPSSSYRQVSTPRSASTAYSR